MSIVTGTSSRYWIGGNKSHFKPDAKGKGEYIYIEDAGEVEPGKMWQMSITWQQQDDPPTHSNKLQQEMTLTVNIIGAGSKIIKTYTSSHKNKGYQKVNFCMPKGAERVEYKIQRTRNAGGKVNLGYSLQVSEP